MNELKELIGDQYSIGDFFSPNVDVGDTYPLCNGEIKVIEAWGLEEGVKYGYVKTLIEINIEGECNLIPMIWNAPDDRPEWDGWDFDGFYGDLEVE